MKSSQAAQTARELGTESHPSRPPNRQNVPLPNLPVDSQIAPLYSFPAELRDRGQWVVWKLEPRPGDPTKLTKVPYSIGGRCAKDVTDPRTWSTFADAVRALGSGRFAGVGFVFTVEDPYAGIDLDDVVQDGEIQPWASGIVQTLSSYTEYSPSGTGLHVICKGRLPANGRRRGPVEMYSAARYFTVTGAHLPGTPLTVEQRDDAIAAVHAGYIARPEASPIVAIPRSQPALNMDDAELLRCMFAARNGRAIAALWSGDLSRHRGDNSVADLALCGHLAFYTGGDQARMDRLFRRSALMRPKWDERRGAGTYGARTIERAVRSMRHAYAPGAACRC